MSSKTAAAAKTSWRVEIVRLPLPSASIGEDGRTDAAVSPPREFPTLKSALEHAEALIQRGYLLHMIGPQEQDWDHMVIVAYINEPAFRRRESRAGISGRPREISD